MKLLPRMSAPKDIKVIQRRKNSRKSPKKIPVQQIVGACQSNGADISQSALAKLRSCSVQLTKLKNYTKEHISDKHASQTGVVDDEQIEINLKISSRKASPISPLSTKIQNQSLININNSGEERFVVIDHEHLEVESCGMTIEISSEKLEVVKEVLTNFSTTKDEVSSIESTGKSNQTLNNNSALIDSNDSLPVLRKSARNRLLKEGAIQTLEKANERYEEIQTKKVQVLSSIQRTKIIWSQLIARDFKPSVGTIVCAKMNTFWPWPAQIIRIQSSKKVRVLFFGDLTQGTVDKTQCVPYKECAAVIRLYLESIPKDLRLQYLELLHPHYDENNRSAYLVHMSRRALYMQAVEDIGLYLELNISFLREILHNEPSQ